MSLEGKAVIVTRARRQAGRLTALLTARGAKVLHVPTIETAPPPTWREVDGSIRRLARGGFAWVAFTSANGVERFFSRIEGPPKDAFSDAKVAAVGSSTKAALEQRGVEPDLVPERYTALDLAEALGSGEERAILLPRAETVPPDMVQALRARGWHPHEVTAYRTVAAKPTGADAAATAAGDFDAVAFTSASTVRGFAESFPIARLGLGQADPPRRIVACIGPVTATQCEKLGLRVDAVAIEHTIPGLVVALEETL